MLILSLLFSTVYCSENRLKFNIIYMEKIFYYLTYQDLENYIFEKNLLPLKNYGMDVRFSGNNGIMTCTCIWDDL